MKSFSFQNYQTTKNLRICFNLKYLQEIQNVHWVRLTLRNFSIKYMFYKCTLHVIYIHL